MAYERILVAIDLTDEAAEVLAAAQQQAAASEAPELHLINVVKPLQLTHGGIELGASAAAMGLDQQLREQATELVTQWANEAGIPKERLHLKVGNPASEIRATAQEIQADLIVIGTHGRHGLGLLLGSTANGVLHGVQCDVLTVRVQS